MLRKILMACVAATAIAVIAVPSDASARGAAAVAADFTAAASWRLAAAAAASMVAASAVTATAAMATARFYPLYGAGIGLGLYGAYNYGCYRTVRVFTPYGPRWRRVWVCG